MSIGSLSAAEDFTWFVNYDDKSLPGEGWKVIGTPKAGMSESLCFGSLSNSLPGGEVEGEFGPEKPPWLLTLAQPHGAAAFAALISFGMIVSSHLLIAWRTKMRRKSGLLTTAYIITITAWGLHCAGDADWRVVITAIHLGAGNGLPLSIALPIATKVNQGI